MSAKGAPFRGATALEQALEHRVALCSKGMLTVAEACEYATFSVAFLYKRMQDGEIAYVQAGRRRMIPKRALDEWLADRLILR